MFRFFRKMRRDLKKNIIRIAAAFFIPCFVMACLSDSLFLLTVHAEDVPLPPKSFFMGYDCIPPRTDFPNYGRPAKVGISWAADGGADTHVYSCGKKSSNGSATVAVAFVNSDRYPDATILDYGQFAFNVSNNTYSSNFNTYDTWTLKTRLTNGDYCVYFWFSSNSGWSDFSPFGGLVDKPSTYSFPDDFLSDLGAGNIPEYIDTNTDNYSLDKSLGHVTNAKWKHLVSDDLKSQVVAEGFSQYGVGVDGTAKMDSYTYSRYSSFSKDKCSFATKSSTGLNLNESRYQLQYCSRVQMTFHYNLLGVIPTDNTKDYTKRFTSPKPYPITVGCSFDASSNIESLFAQGFAYNESLPAFGTALRNFLFDETKYWIDVRIIDTKTKTYGAWFAMALEDNKARVITTDDGDIGSDVDSEEDAGNYTKIEGSGDTFEDAEHNSHEVTDTEQFSKDKWTDASKGVKDSYSTAKSLINMVSGFPQMIGTLFSWLPSWCLALVAVFFSIIIVLTLLRFVLGS